MKSAAALMWKKLGVTIESLVLGSESNLVSQADINASEYKGPILIIYTILMVGKRHLLLESR